MIFYEQRVFWALKELQLPQIKPYQNMFKKIFTKLEEKIF